MNILITGANGFLGSHVLKHFRQGHMVSCLSRHPFDEKVKTVLFKDGNDPAIEQAFPSIDVVIHIAAQLHGNSEEMRLANVVLTEKLVALSGKHAVKHFILISTENVTQDNTDIYTSTKREAESTLSSFPTALILRPTIIYGPGDTKYVGKLARIIRRFPIVPVLGNGAAKFQFIHVNDIVTILDHAITERMTGTFTIAGPASISYNVFMRNIMSALSVQKRLLHLPLFLLRPMAFFLDLIMRNPPLTPGQLSNLKKDRDYDIKAVVQKFKYTPTSLEDGLAYLKKEIK